MLLDQCEINQEECLDFFKPMIHFVFSYYNVATITLTSKPRDPNLSAQNQIFISNRRACNAYYDMGMDAYSNDNRVARLMLSEIIIDELETTLIKLSRRDLESCLKNREQHRYLIDSLNETTVRLLSHQPLVDWFGVQRTNLPIGSEAKISCYDLLCGVLFFKKQGVKQFGPRLLRPQIQRNDHA